MARVLIALFSFLFFALVCAGAGVLYIFYQYGRDLPDFSQLADYEPPVMTRIYAGDGSLIAEYASEKRVFVPLDAMPKRVTNAFLSAEDKSFYTHPGVDFMGVFRATVTNLRNYHSDRRPVGASTITQQVAKNFLLTNEVSFSRKIKEAILAFRIERSFSKHHILELYLNEIYLGFGSYGVTAAALNYFDKSLNELSISEIAFLAALPKAPNNYNPIKNPEAAKDRRDWVIGRMMEDGYITPAEAKTAIAEPLVVRDRSETELFKGAEHFAEDVRRELLQRYGESVLYKGGLQVRTTLDPKMQRVAQTALRGGLLAYDRRHGWRGRVSHIPTGPGWLERLAEVHAPAGILDEWQLAVVLSLDATKAIIGLENGQEGTIPLSELTWARQWLPNLGLGPQIRTVSDVLEAGDVVLVQGLEPDAKGEKVPSPGPGTGTSVFGLRQLPAVDGAMVAMDPHTGRVVAMVGGFSYERSEFNRATQAMRQPGSAFKPFVYLTALDSGYTPSSIILDAPAVFEQGPGLPPWRPHNYGNDFLGPTTLRVGVEKSRNLMTVRLAQAVGMKKIAATATKFGIVDRLETNLSSALGSGETTVLRLTGAYAMLVNGGKRIIPTLIDRIQDRTGHTIYRHDDRECPNCRETFWTGQSMPELPDTREQITDPMSAYQIVSILEGVVQHGTGRKVAAVGKPLAGKTGTSNDSNDTWFVGFAPDLAVGVFVGFDVPHSLGGHETGGSVAAPIFRDFMASTLVDQPATPFRIPPGIRLVRVNHHSGRPAEPGDKDVIVEAFKPGTVPGEAPTTVLDGGIPGVTEGPGAETGGTESGGTVTTGEEMTGEGATGVAATPVVPEAGGLY
ncbi:MAG: penicillin-binding protein 1A [Alphaproteobacteria bacterium]|nr:penicillin-binding protein 1A [Alphaproteobacteria bacterium]